VTITRRSYVICNFYGLFRDYNTDTKVEVILFAQCVTVALSIELMSGEPGSSVPADP
jgi:hypothetical protein